MTLSTTTSKISYAGDGSTVSFSIPFLFLTDGDITATLRDANGTETTWILATQYTLAGAGVAAGGTLTVETSPTDYTPASGETLVIRRIVAETQGTDYPEGGAFPASAHEDALDKLTMLVQQKSEELVRALLFPTSDPASSLGEVPNSTNRASKFLGFDAAGVPVASAGSVDTLTVSAFMATVLDDANAAAARATLGAGTGDGTLDDLVGDTTPQLGGTLDTNGKAIDESEGSAVASAATADIWATDGNTVHVTGTTTITSFGTAARIGAWRKVIFDGALTLTHGANLNLPGSANITTAANDFAYVYAETTTLFKVLYFKADGTAVVGGGITLGTEQATTSGTAFNFTGIPAGTKRITILFEVVSLSNLDDILIQIGDAGGIETSGYVSTSEGGVVNSTVGFILKVNSGARICSGHMVLILKDSANFTWIASHVVKVETTASSFGAGDKSLSAELTQVRITRTGTDTFDGGSVNIIYE